MISTAYAQTSAAAAPVGGSLLGYLPLILVFVIFYFMVLRPQAKRYKEHMTLLQNLKRGDYVVTSGGLVGQITHVAETIVTLEVASGVEVKVSKPSVNALVEENNETRKPVAVAKKK